jgi:hypothetical protein
VDSIPDPYADDVVAIPNDYLDIVTPEDTHASECAPNGQLMQEHARIDAFDSGTNDGTGGGESKSSLYPLLTSFEAPQPAPVSDRAHAFNSTIAFRGGGTTRTRILQHCCIISFCN